MDESASVTAARRCRVVIVEDDETLLGMLAAAAEEEGCTAAACATGGDALRAAAERRPDVILLDWGLPDMDGGEFARRYRASVADPAPLVLVTALQGEQRRSAAAEIQSAAVLPKPFELDELLAVLRRFTDCLT